MLKAEKKEINRKGHGKHKCIAKKWLYICMLVVVFVFVHRNVKEH